MRKSAALSFILFFIFALSTGTTVSAQISNDITVCRGEVITITARLLQNITFGSPVPNQELEFYDETINQYISSAVTDSQGFASIDWTIPSLHPLGLTMLNVTFRGNESLYLSPSCQYVVISIVSRTDMEISVIGTQFAPGDIISALIRLTNDLGNPIMDAPVILMANGEPIATADTNSSGFASFDTICDSSWYVLGDNVLEFVYYLDLETFNSGAHRTYGIQVNQVTTSLSISALPQECMLNDTLIVESLLDTPEGPLSDEVVNFLVNGVIESVLSLNQTGGCLSYVLIDDTFLLGRNEIAIQFMGTERYAGCTVSKSITVSSPVHMDLVFEEPLLLGSNSSLYATVWDLFHRPISNMSLRVHDLATNYSFITSPVSGSAPVHIEYPIVGQKGVRSILIEVLGCPYIVNNTSVFDFIVWVQPSITVQESNIQGYASPDQEIKLRLLLTVLNGSFPNIQLGLQSPNGSVLSTFHTDIDGFASVSWTASNMEGDYLVYITFFGNENAYELASLLSYSYVVTRIMPLQVNLLQYAIISPLQEIQIYLTLEALNGSKIVGQTLYYEWLHTHGAVLSQVGGIIVVHLPVPSTPGNHSFLFQVKSTAYTRSVNGSVLILVSWSDISASQGIGIQGLATSLLFSGGITALPLIRRWYLVG